MLVTHCSRLVKEQAISGCPVADPRRIAAKDLSTFPAPVICRSWYGWQDTFWNADARLCIAY